MFVVVIRIAFVVLLIRLVAPQELRFTGGASKFSFQVRYVDTLCSLNCKYNFYNNIKSNVVDNHIFICLIKVYKSVKDAAMKHKDVSVLVNFASLRSAYDVTMETMMSEECKGIRTIAIIAEGIPENMTRRLLRVAKEKDVTVIGTLLREYKILKA